MLAGLISHIQRFSLHDGPGIRTTVFLKGCPLSCAWCHNPENLSPRTEVVWHETRCLRCGQCVSVCPSLPKPKATANRRHRTSRKPEPPVACQQCGACIEVCPTGAREIIGRSMTIQELRRALLADLVFFEESNGGVTFSGGEPLSQFEFLQAGLETCRSQSIHTAVDTCGFASRENLLTLAPLVDLFLYDLKFISEPRHIEYCGVSNQPILANVKALAEIHPHLWLRIPIIPGVNTDEEELNSLAQFAAELPHVGQVNLLPYHKTGVPKYERHQRRYRFPNLPPPSKEDMHTAAAHFTAKGIPVKIGG